MKGLDISTNTHVQINIDGRMPQIILGLWGFYVLGMQDALVTKSLIVE